MKHVVKHIVAGCFSGLPESGLLAPALKGVAVLDRIADRRRVVQRAIMGHTAALILPSADAQGMTTAALASACIEEAPSLPVIILAGGAAGAHRAIRRSIRTGAVVASVRTAGELRTVVRAVIGLSPEKSVKNP